MKVLMFGWEFPPHISGGLGTACHGLTRSLSEEEVDVLFVVPKLKGGESSANTAFINASKVPISTTSKLEKLIVPKSENRKVRESLFKVLKPEKHFQQIEVSSSLRPYHSPSYPETRDIENWNYTIDSRREDTLESGSDLISERTTVEKSAPYAFSGTYGPQLLEEVKRYAEVAAAIAAQHDFDVIHAHDWMTYLAGIAAKKISGKPLVVHIHATEFDRSGEFVDTRVHAIEHEGMSAADCVVAVSEWTRKVVIEKYLIPANKVKVVHNGIIPKGLPVKMFSLPPVGSHIVTFFGRITHQKGPLYFVEAARHVLKEIPEAHFVVAGSGDQLPVMIERIAQLRLSSHFHFTGFLKGNDIEKVWSISNVYVMPSVSEPFGIAPLEAIQAGVPVIISKQSGVAEVMPHAIKVDFWNTEQLASAICSVLKYSSLSKTLSKNGSEEVQGISWKSAAKKLTKLYHELTIEQLPA